MTLVRSNWVDYAKGIGIILVVYGHMVGGIDKIELSNVFLVSRKIIYHFHIPLFFFLSGLFVNQSLMKRGVKEFILTKIGTILYPYFLWSFLQGVTLIFISHYTLYDLLAIPYKPIQHFWFLHALFFIYLVYAFVMSKSIYLFYLIMVPILIFYFIPSHVNLTKIWEGDFFLYFIFFIIGIFYQKYGVDNFFKRKVSLISVFLVCILFSVLEMGIKFIQSPSLYFLLMALVGVLMVMMISKLLERNNRFQVVKKIGAYTIPIYLAHGFGGSGIRMMLYNFFRIENSLFLISISTLTGIIIPFILYRLATKFNFLYLFELKNVLSHRFNLLKPPI